LAGTLAPGIYQLYRHYHTNPIYDANHQGQTVTSTSNLLTLHVTVPNVIDLGIKGFKLQDEKDSCVDGQIVAKYMVKNFGALDATNVVCSIYMADHASDLSGNPSTNPNITPIGVLNLGTIVGGDLTHDVVHSFDVPNAVGKKWFSVYVTDHCAG
jgi:hypothetical protein